MKSLIKLIALSFCLLITITSCQDEETEIINPPEETITQGSNIATILARTASNDGSLDDILDNASCLEITLPVTVTANGISVTINQLDDLSLIEDIFNQFVTDQDNIEFIFPITITLSDFTEIVIEDLIELNELIENCTNENEPIDCVDFQYPISFSLYDANFQIIETVSIADDTALYNFIDGLQAGVLASLNFPVTMVYANGNTVEVTTNQELEDIINNCDDDVNNCTEQEINSTLQACLWNISNFNSTQTFSEYDLNFKGNDSLQVTMLNATTIEANWQLSTSTTNSTELIITNFNDDVNGSWIIENCEDDRLEFTNQDNAMVLEQNCDYDCSLQYVEEYLLQCYWPFVTSLYDNIAGEILKFNTNGELLLINSVSNQIADTGSWSLSAGNNTILLTISLQQNTMISLDWTVVVCDYDRIELINGNDNLVLEQDCNIIIFDCPDLQANIGDECFNNQNQEGILNANCECEVETNPFECYQGFNANLTVCDDNTDGFAVFNLTEAYANCSNPTTDVLTYYITLIDAENATNAIATPEVYINTITFTQTIYVRVQLANSGEYEVFEITLVVEDCNTTNCTQQEIEEYIFECHIEATINDSNNQVIDVLQLDFNANGEVIVNGIPAVTEVGTWSINNTNTNINLEISGLNVFGVINGIWTLNNCSGDNLVFTRTINNELQTLILEKNC